MQTTWYFDFVSPFSYLQLRQLDKLPTHIELELKPVLFAGLLAHHGNLGPAEIPAKRRHTYRFCEWYARHHGIDYRMPPAHPFNPIKPLRLAIALGASQAVVGNIFEFIFAKGERPDTDEGFAALGAQLDATDAAQRIQADAVKQGLRANTEEAAARNVFGVPTLYAQGEGFWGIDATQMFIDFASEPTRFEDDEMRRVSELPVGIERAR